MDERTLGSKRIKVMRVTILQPSYLPWLGYFEQMSRSDKFVLLDDVQYTRRDWRNRNRVRVNEGWAWLTVPVLQKVSSRKAYLRPASIIRCLGGKNIY